MLVRFFLREDLQLEFQFHSFACEIMLYFNDRGISSTFQVLPGQVSLWEMELVLVKVGQLLGLYGRIGTMGGGKHCEFKLFIFFMLNCFYSSYIHVDFWIFPSFSKY